MTSFLFSLQLFLREATLLKGIQLCAKGNNYAAQDCDTSVFLHLILEYTSCGCFTEAAKYGLGFGWRLKIIPIQIFILPSVMRAKSPWLLCSLFKASGKLIITTLSLLAVIVPYILCSIGRLEFFRYRSVDPPPTMP